MLKNKTRAIEFINRNGMLLTFPIKNQKEPRSLWSEFHPRKKMTWEWSDEGDNDVVQMWHLMKSLSSERDVVYSKWFRGRATFFSRDVFTALLKILEPHNLKKATLSRTSSQILESLIYDSPMSTRDVKKLNDLQGKDNEPEFQRATKSLFSQLLIVGCGEVDDGAFPSLSVGATQAIYEDLWSQSQTLTTAQARAKIDSHFAPTSAFYKFLNSLVKKASIE